MNFMFLLEQRAPGGREVFERRPQGAWGALHPGGLQSLEVVGIVRRRFAYGGRVKPMSIQIKADDEIQQNKTHISRYCESIKQANIKTLQYRAAGRTIVKVKVTLWFR